MDSHMDEKLTDNFEVVEKVLIGTHAEFRWKLNNLPTVVFHYERILLFLLFV